MIDLDQPLKFSMLSDRQQNAVLRVLCNSLYASTRKLFIDLEHTRALHDKSLPRSYGETCMDGQDRLNNRLMADFIITDNGLRADDEEACQWFADVMTALYTKDGGAQ